MGAITTSWDVIGEKQVILVTVSLFLFFLFSLFSGGPLKSVPDGHMELPSFQIARVQRDGSDRVIGLAEVESVGRVGG